MNLKKLQSLRVIAGNVMALLLVACGDPPKPSAPPAKVAVEMITQRNLPLTLSYPARVSGSRVVEVRARVRGQIIERSYREGSSVKAGELLFRIDPVPYRNSYDQTAAQADMQRAALAEAESDFKRVETLVKEGAVSRREFEQASATLLRTRASLIAAEAVMRSAKLDLEYTDVRAPVAGVASKEAVTVGNLVNGGNNSTGDLLTSIVQADPAYVEFSAPEPEYLRLRDLASVSAQGLAVRIKAGSSCHAVGKVDFTDSFVNARTGTIRGRAIFSNPDGCLVSGQFLSIEVQGRALPNTIAIAKTAVFFNDQGAMAWVVGNDNVVTPRAVQLDGSWNDSWIVKDGVKPGERVIVEGILKVSPGAKVTPITRAEEARKVAQGDENTPNLPAQESLAGPSTAHTQGS
jgi:membrane fusion protein (multidrug efflux system)